MKKVLIIVSSPRKDSVSTYLAKEFSNMLNTNDIEIVDVSNMKFPNYDENLMNEISKDVHTSKECMVYDEVLEKFMKADRIVISYPNWNLMCPPNIVYYMLCVCRTGKTFKYTDEGSQGLLENKKALLISACGGQNIENVTFMGSSWLKGTLNFIGITDVKEVSAQLIEVRRDELDKVKEESLKELRDVAKTFLK